MLTTLAAFAVMLGVLIVVHEFGHYAAARLSGVKVLRFSIGFGQPIVSRRVGADGTEWALGAFPLGGYVKMLDENEGEVAPHELPRAFNRQPVGKRMFIVMAGPLANFALAVLLYWLFFMHGVTGLKAAVGDPPQGTPAAVAGLRAGDQVVAVDGTGTATWQDLRWQILRHGFGQDGVDLTVRRSGDVEVHRHLNTTGISVDGEADVLGQLGLVPFEPSLPAVVENLTPQGVASRAGMLSGDKVLSVNGEPILHWQDMVKRVQPSAGKPLTFVVERNGKEIALVMTPEAFPDGKKTIGRIGAGPHVDEAVLNAMFTEVSYPPHTAFLHALGKTWETSAFTLEMLGRMVVGQVSWRNVSGPVTIADYAGQSARMGWFAFLNLMALVSVSLGVLNLLPIPVLDGGHLMYHIAEFAKGGPVSLKAMEIGQRLGLALLFLLMTLAFYNDINRLLAN